MSTPNVVIEPQINLVFSPENRITSSSITITNPYDKYIAYKVLINTPKKYVVSPPVGVIRPHSSKILPVSTKLDLITETDHIRILIAFSEKIIPSDFWSTMCVSNILHHDLKVSVGIKNTIVATSETSADVQKLHNTMTHLRMEYGAITKQADTYRRWAGSLIVAILLLVFLFITFFSSYSSNSSNAKSLNNEL